MRKISVSILIGIIAGIIDVIPMLMQGLDIYACLSAFTHWVLMGVLISYVKFVLPAWLKGLIIAVCSAIPIMIIVAKEDPISIIPILSMSVILGALVGLATDKFTS